MTRPFRPDTIVALASGQGRAAIAVIRVSGPATQQIVERVAGVLPPPRAARFASFRDAESLIDRGLVLWFPGPKSFTGEDAAEFQVHGGRATISAMLKCLLAFPGVRMAEPGEFTRQAFLNGKLDLSAVEGLSDLIEAETEAQRRQALRQASGRLRDQALVWRAALLEAAALIEGEIDFSDEADVPKQTIARVCDLLAPVLAELQRELSSRTAERIRDGLSVVIAGPPNAGKSTLMNALARRDIAIVSEHAGTTRDLLEVHLDIGGVPMILIDTAGLRESTDPVEQIGISRARQRAGEADLILWLSETGADQAPEPAFAGQAIWVASTKSDLYPPTMPPHTEEQARLASRKVDVEAFSISAATGKNLDQLIARLEDFALSSAGGETGLITRARHRQAFQNAAFALEQITRLPDRPIEFLAEDLRLATRALESLVGGVDVEDVLGEIFSRFCVGK